MTLLGISIDIKSLLLNASSPITLTLSGILISVNLLPIKLLLPIISIELGITKEVILL